jgi:hypothetical protein
MWTRFYTWKSTFLERKIIIEAFVWPKLFRCWLPEKIVLLNAWFYSRKCWRACSGWLRCRTLNLTSWLISSHQVVLGRFESKLNVFPLYVFSPGLNQSDGQCSFSLVFTRLLSFAFVALNLTANRIHAQDSDNMQTIEMAQSEYPVRASL